SSRVKGAPSIHVAGDATLDIGLVSVAEMEARVAVETMFIKDESKVKTLKTLKP
ncbi:hypothetical protein SARC_17394, partial [Sphaeroforma arctica JP610]